MRALFALACGLSLSAGCYASHQRTSSPDAGGTPEDAALVLDTGPPGDPCVTVCEVPRVLARIPLALCCDREPAVLDSLVHRDELVVALLIGTTEPMPGPSPVFFLARISRRTGEARIEPIEARAETVSVAAAALDSRGDTLSFVGIHAMSAAWEFLPRVLVARWEGSATSPRLSDSALGDEFESRCPGCYRRGAAVAMREDGAIVGVPSEGQLRLGRVSLETGAVEAETFDIPGVVPNTAMLARGRGASAALTLGGQRDVLGATASPAFALVANESALEAPIAIPGEANDSVPYPWAREGGFEIVRFVRDAGLASGRIRRYAIDGSSAVELGRIPTAGDLPPLLMASTPSALLWVESSLAFVGESDLRVLAAPPASCSAVSPATVVHLPAPVVGRDPRWLTATEADGHTYAFVIERPARDFDSGTLVVIDLGACRAGG